MASTDLLAPCRPWLSRQTTRSNLGQRKYLPSCRTRVFSASANFEPKLSVRALMCSANSVTPRSSCISPSRTSGHQYRGEDTWIVTPVASGHGCGQRTSTRDTHSPSWGGWAAYIAGHRSWWRDPSSCSGGSHHTNTLSSSLPGLIDVRRLDESCI